MLASCMAAEIIVLEQLKGCQQLCVVGMSLVGATAALRKNENL